MARILVIDDEPAIRRSVRKILELAGHEVHEAADGFAGLAHATRPYDVIITDLRMPEFDGIEVITSLRRVDAEVKILLISGGDHRVTGTKAAELGAVWLLAKPFTVPQLQNMIHSIVGKPKST